MKFRHAGDRGDIIYAMPMMKHWGDVDLYIEAASYTRERLTPDKWACLAPLLLSQPYIKSVSEWSGENCENGNAFRAAMNKSFRNAYSRPNAQEREAVRKQLGSILLTDWQLMQFGLPTSLRDEPWILNIEPKPAAEVIINRTGRYRGDAFPWHAVWKKYGKRAAFIGSPQEHHEFCKCCGYVPYVATKDFLEVAQVIKGSKLFVGNWSSPYAVAEGMKHPALVEVWLHSQPCLFNRPGVTHGWDCDVHLPEI